MNHWSGMAQGGCQVVGESLGQQRVVVPLERQRLRMAWVGGNGRKGGMQRKPRGRFHGQPMGRLARLASEGQDQGPVSRQCPEHG